MTDLLTPARFLRASLVVLAVAFAIPMLADDWPHLRGPARTNVSNEEFSLDWSGKTPPLLWRASVGTGYSSIAVQDGRAITIGFRDGEKREQGKDTVWCFDLETGKILWKHSYACPKWASEHAGGPAATPAIGEQFVYTLSKEGHLFALRLDSGKVAWSRNVRREFSVQHRPSKPRKDYGYTGSPLLLGDLLVVQVGGRGASTVALRAATGKTVWKSGNDDGNDGAGYATPMPFVWKKQSLLAVFTLKGLEILESSTGRRRARHEWVTDFGLNIADPSIDGDRILITSSYGKGAALLRFDGKSLKEIHRDRRLRCKFVTPAIWQGHAYALGDGGILKCVNMETGKTLWQQRSLRDASILIAAGKLVLFGGRGELSIGEVSPQGFRELRRTKIHNKQCWTAPTLSGGRLLVRNTPGELLCYDVRGK